jgi:hypothetical protein
VGTATTAAAGAAAAVLTKHRIFIQRQPQQRSADENLCLELRS